MKNNVNKESLEVELMMNKTTVSMFINNVEIEQVIYLKGSSRRRCINMHT